MFGKIFLPLLCFALFIPSAFRAATPNAPVGQISVTEILSKNAAARGGLENWRKVQTLTFSGKMDAGGKANTELPFVWELKRPRKSRLELTVGKDTAIQVYDGQNGWKLRPYLNRREVENFTPDELQVASRQPDLDGPLLDAAAKGNKVELVGSPSVEGRPTYQIKVTDPNGRSQDFWIDANSFLELKVEGTPRRLDGKVHDVSVFYRDYRSVEGIMVPFVLETVVDGVKQTEKMHFEKVVVNPKLDDALFTKPK